jgi:hypothetical protein
MNRGYHGRGRPFALKTPRKPAVDVSVETYARICRIADLYETNLKTALDAVLADLPRVGRREA